MEAAHVYYQACHGRWRCPLDFHVTDTAALRASGMAWADRMSMRVIAAWPAWLGRLHLHTSVTYDGSPDVIHTTVVRWLGMPMMKSVETIQLHPDGEAFTMHGEQRVAPAWWHTRVLRGTGVVDSSATRASYAFEWLGVRLEQTTQRERDRVTVTQTGPGFEGVQRLQRQ